MTRKLEDVTDEELVEQVAAFGTEGADIWGDEDNPLTTMAVNVGLEHLLDERIDDVDEGALLARLERVSGIVVESYVVRLTPEEWGRRLEGLSAAEIAAALKGSAS